MGDVVEFPVDRSRERAGAAPEDESGQVLIFPGVRMERRAPMGAGAMAGQALAPLAEWPAERDG